MMKGYLPEIEQSINNPEDLFGKKSTNVQVLNKTVTLRDMQWSVSFYLEPFLILMTIYSVFLQQMSSILISINSLLKKS